VDVSFHANVKGIAPGQSAVFYEGDDVIGRRDYLWEQPVKVRVAIGLVFPPTSFSL
jgi:hypothetical protein